MSNYTLSSPLAIHSTSSNGTINLFSAGSSNSVQLQSPSTLPSNITFTLPNTNPASGGSFLETNGSGALSWTIPSLILQSFQFPFNVRTFNNSTTAVTTTSATPVVVDYVQLYVSGGPQNVAFHAIIQTSNTSTTVRVQLFDSTNSVTLADATSGTLSAATPTIFFVGNIPGSAFVGVLWAPQVRVARASGTGTVVFWGYQLVAL